MKVLGLTEINEADPIKKLAAIFKRFSIHAKDSPIYTYLSEKIAEDEAVLKSLPNESTQPLPNLYFSAINFLLYRNPGASLSRYFPNHSGKTSLTEEFYQEFKRFYFSQMSEVKSILDSRLVQTNEVRRCTLLLPAVSLIAAKVKGPLALIDVGTSSGLNLLMDHYKVEYSNGIILGDLQSKLSLTCTLKGQLPENLAKPQILSRIGIDLNPLDLNKEEEKLWAISLIWPDQLARIERIQQALTIFSQHKVELLKGSALDLIIPTIEKLPAKQTACVMHSFVLNQFPVEARAEFEKQLISASLKRDVSRISVEWLATEFSELVVEQYSSGEKIFHQKLADVHQHGEWMNWQA